MCWGLDQRKESTFKDGGTQSIMLFLHRVTGNGFVAREAAPEELAKIETSSRLFESKKHRSGTGGTPDWNPVRVPRALTEARGLGREE